MDKFEAAKVLHCSPQRVVKLCRDGVIIGKKPGKSWVISEKSIEEYLTRADNPKGESVQSEEKNLCHSGAGVVPITAISQRRAEDELSARLALLTESRRKKPTTKSSMTSGRSRG